MLPMKIAHTALTEVPALIADDRYVAEQKQDGARGLLRWEYSGLGTEPTLTPQIKFAAAVQHLPEIKVNLDEVLLALGAEEAWVDGEIMVREGTLRVFDLPYLRLNDDLGMEAGGESRVIVVGETPWHDRRAWLETMGGLGVVEVVPTARTAQEKQRLWDDANARGVEGVVFKRIDSRYEPGRRSTEWLKAKLIYTADVVVMSWDKPDPKHGSCTFGVYGADGELRPLGACSLIGKPAVEVGDVIEITVLYREPGGGVIQPRMMRTRPDRTPESCTEDQFRMYSREMLTL